MAVVGAGDDDVSFWEAPGGVEEVLDPFSRRYASHVEDQRSPARNPQPLAETTVRRAVDRRGKAVAPDADLLGGNAALHDRVPFSLRGDDDCGRSAATPR